jgi:hypothetical protein
MLLKITGRCETRPLSAASNSPRAIPVISLLLGCVKWRQECLLQQEIQIGHFFYQPF